MTMTWLNRMSPFSRTRTVQSPCFHVLRTTRLYSSAALTSLGKIVKSPFPDVEIPEKGTMTDHAFKDVHVHKDRVALIEAESGRSFTYQDLKSSVRKLGSGLTSICRFKKGDVVCMYSASCMEYVVAFHGVTSIGGIFTTCNPSFTASELLRQLKDSSPRFLIADSERAVVAMAAANQAGVEAVYVIGQADGYKSFSSLLDNDGENFPDVDINPREDIAILPYSSGTTGLPKGVMLTHFNVTANMYQATIPGLFHYVATDTGVVFVPMAHIAGLIIACMSFLHLKTKIIVMQKYSPKLLLETIQKHKVTIVPAVPPVVLMMAKSPLVDEYDLTSVQEVYFGGACIGGSTIQDLKKRFPNLKRIRQGYGMTEVAGFSHVIPDNTPDEKYTSFGCVIPNLQCKVVDVNTGEELGPNKSGEICVQGPNVMKGYLNKPEITADTVTSDGWLHTGDFGYYDEDRYFYIVERLKELIKYKGLQVAPSELEELLLSHPSVADAAVVGIPDEEAGEVPKAFVIRKADVTAEELKKFVEENVAPFKKLRGGLEFVTEIPKTPTGKILKRVLIEQINQ